MNFYRSVLGTETEESAASYTTAINNNIQMGSAKNYISTCILNYLDNSNAFYNFNSEIIVGDMVDNCDELCQFLPNFNSNITFGLNCISLQSAIHYCNNFNRNVNIPKRVKECWGLLYGSRNFNAYINFQGNNVINAVSMLERCYSYNKPISLPNGIKNIDRFFYSSNYNQKTYIPASVTNASFAFGECKYMTRNIYFNQTTMNNVHIGGLLYNKDTTKAINIFTNTQMGPYTKYNYLVRNSQYTNNIVLTWENVTNGYYNNLYNIYVYYNYQP